VETRGEDIQLRLKRINPGNVPFDDVYRTSFTHSLIFAGTGRVLLDTDAFGLTGIPVRFVVAATNRVVLHGAGPAVGGAFLAIGGGGVPGAAGQGEQDENSDFFHG
jgi:hypothetical protein